MTLASGLDGVDAITETVADGSGFELPENPFDVPEHYYFGGWEYEETVYQPGDEVNVNFNVTLEMTVN